MFIMIRLFSEFPFIFFALTLQLVLVAVILTIGLRSKLPREDKWILGIVTLVNAFLGLIVLLVWRKKLS